jgi:hypothetical protein
MVINNKKKSIKRFVVIYGKLSQTTNQVPDRFRIFEHEAAQKSRMKIGQV